MNMNFKSIALSAIAITAVSGHTIAQSDESMTVTVDTPDSVLLENMGVEEMAKAKTPSTVLTLTVENIPYDIGISVENDNTILHVPQLPKRTLNEIKQVYEVAMNTNNVIMRIDENISMKPQVSVEGAGTVSYSDSTGQ